MASIQEVVNAAHSIKTTSGQLAQMSGMASQALQQKGSEIASIVRGSSTGQEAVQAVVVAARSLANAAASMKSLERACESCITNLTK